MWSAGTGGSIILENSEYEGDVGSVVFTGKIVLNPI
jgi:hypothetical protein